MARTFLAPFYSAQGADPFMSLHRDINRLFDEAFRGGGAGAAGDQGGGSIPARMNVAETDEDYRVSVELPGLSPDEVEVLLNEDLLTIRGEKKFERRDDKENYHLVECSYGTLQRSLRLPAAVDAQQVEAKFENGVLRVTLPKSKTQERARRIQVQGGLEGSTARIGTEGNDRSQGDRAEHMPPPSSNGRGGEPGQSTHA